MEARAKQHKLSLQDSLQAFVASVEYMQETFDRVNETEERLRTIGLKLDYLRADGQDAGDAEREREETEEKLEGEIVNEVRDI